MYVCLSPVFEHPEASPTPFGGGTIANSINGTRSPDPALLYLLSVTHAWRRSGVYSPMAGSEVCTCMYVCLSPVFEHPEASATPFGGGTIANSIIGTRSPDPALLYLLSLTHAWRS